MIVHVLQQRGCYFSVHLACPVVQVGNIQLGIPVRMIRKNKAKGSEIGSIYIFDGLYDVVRPSACLHRSTCCA